MNWIPFSSGKVNRQEGRKGGRGICFCQAPVLTGHLALLSIFHFKDAITNRIEPKVISQEFETGPSVLCSVSFPPLCDSHSAFLGVPSAVSHSLHLPFLCSLAKPGIQALCICAKQSQS